MAAATVVVINVASIEKSLEGLVRAGGTKLMDKQPIPNIGYYVYAKDSEGNVIGLFEDLKK